MVKAFIKKLLPKKAIFFYHKYLALLASFLYGQPSNQLIVIGVTGTAGKSSTVYLIGKILEKCDLKVGWTSSISFKDAQGEKINNKKMTMPGRFFLQKFLKNLVKNNYQVAVIETSSEGILQSRHLGINYDLAIFTNLSPEHLEVHGSFENYKKTKGELFRKLKAQSSKLKTTAQNLKLKKTIIANLDDEHADYFLSFQADEYLGYTLKSNAKTRIHPNDTNKIKILEAEKRTGSSFMLDNSLFQLQLPGQFNIYNALAVLSVCQYLKIPLEQAKKALEKIESIPGRMEEIVNHPFKIIIDYAHTPIELQKIYELLNCELIGKEIEAHPVIRQDTQSNDKANSKLICVLGSCGGGRDKWKRPELGKLAVQYCNYIVLTNEDPYDEDPGQILSDIKSGITGSQFPISNLYQILNREEAIKKAISLASPGDTIIITGKGSEQWMCLKNGKKIAWDDRQIALKEFNKLSTAKD